MNEAALRRAVIITARAINDSGLNPGKAGNVSARLRGGFLITPTGVTYDLLRPAMIVRMLSNGTAPGGQLKPSSEWRFHRDVYRARPEVGAIVHVHSPYATALACQRRGIPAFHYMVAVAGGDSIRCAPYATFGTQALSNHAVRALRGRRACLLANHGLIALGDGLPSALALAVEVEFLARQYCLSLQVGDPVMLGKREMRVVLEKFKTYGSQD
ncbi:MAG TPA: class II aldolase/adducin family protein [Gammaproteobacteria bacterium]|nr:class II aldolase/adducin family protein [Gammaproteobacteria bacterium]